MSVELEYQIQNSYGLWLPTNKRIWNKFHPDSRRVVEITRRVLSEEETRELAE
jgi:hypothetical protein